MKILYTQPIFLPNSVLFDKNVESIMSFINVINNTDITIDINIGGWAISDDYWNSFIDKLNIPNINVTRFDKNYGKAYVINKLTEDIGSYDYLLTADSDIIFKDTTHFIDRILTIVDKSQEFSGKKFGVMGINQEVANCHMMEHLSENTHSFLGHNDNLESIRWHNSPSGIAGGCLFTSSENWISVGGYREMGVYSGEDAYFLIDTNKIGNSHFLAETISVIHPPETNQRYQEWKVMVCQRDSHGGSTGIDDDKINEAENFWEI